MDLLIRSALKGTLDPSLLVMVSVIDNTLYSNLKFKSKMWITRCYNRHNVNQAKKKNDKNHGLWDL